MILQGVKLTIQPLGVGYANRPKKAKMGGVCGVFPYIRLPGFDLTASATAADVWQTCDTLQRACRWGRGGGGGCGRGPPPQRVRKEGLEREVCAEDRGGDGARGQARHEWPQRPPARQDHVHGVGAEAALEGHEGDAEAAPRDLDRQQGQGPAGEGAADVRAGVMEEVADGGHDLSRDGQWTWTGLCGTPRCPCQSGNKIALRGGGVTRKPIFPTPPPPWPP